jgi:arylsulfatase A-like enzyme
MPDVLDPPNVLWICTDQQRSDTIGALGNPYVRTQNLDRLVSEGVAFTRAYCQTPICTPSRASFLTGMYPSSVHGCTNGNDHWADAAPLVTKLLADAGYDCGLAGKLHLAGAQGRVEPRAADGYRLFHWSHGPRDNWEQGHAYADWVRSQGGALTEFDRHPERIPPSLHQSTWCAEQAIGFIEEKLDQPWLISVNTFDPHPRGSVFAPPQEILDRYDPASMPGPLFRESDLAAQARLDGIDFQTKPRRPEDYDAKEVQAAYYAMVELVDENVGRILAALERTGQRENTIIIFMSDHGEMLGDHGLLLKGCRFYEGLVRVPLIFSWPGHFRQAIVSQTLVELIDIAPTILDICGLAVPERMQGRSLVPILTGASDTHQQRDFVRCEYYRALNPDVPNRLGFSGTYATMIRNERYKLVIYHGHDIGELYDLRQDPGEFQNLWDEPEHRDVEFDLMKKSFDALAFAVDVGPEQITYY